MTDERGGVRLRAVFLLLALVPGSASVAAASSRPLPTPAASGPVPRAGAASPHAPVASAGQTDPAAAALLLPGAPAASVSAAPRRIGGAARLVDFAWAAYARTEDALVADPVGPEGGVGAAGLLLNRLVKVGSALAAMQSTLAVRDPRFFAAMGEGSRALVELQTVWRRGGPGGPAQPEISRGFADLSGSFRTLRAAYGQEEVRRRDGRPLSAAEARQLARMQAAQRQLAARLQALAARARERQDQRLLAELSRLDAELGRLAAAPPTLDGYLNVLIRSDVVLGEWAAIGPLVQPEEQAEWAAADAAAQELTTDADTGFVLVADLGSGATWTYLEAEATQPADPGAGGPPDGVAIDPGDFGTSADARVFGDSLASDGSGALAGGVGLQGLDGAWPAGQEAAPAGTPGAMELEPFDMYREPGGSLQLAAGEETRGGAASSPPGSVERLADGTILVHGGTPPAHSAAEEDAESADDPVPDDLPFSEQLDFAAWTGLQPGRAPLCSAVAQPPNACFK
ncbi:MAG TPA: hypothetical protein VHQ90_20275 [Thermoanaerobaculia bacterium]|nr:hypothetical protein [Thermoanaerobaculia bacterium]